MNWHLFCCLLCNWANRVGSQIAVYLIPMRSSSWLVSSANTITEGPQLPLTLCLAQVPLRLEQHLSQKTFVIQERRALSLTCILDSWSSCILTLLLALAGRLPPSHTGAQVHPHLPEGAVQSGSLLSPALDFRNMVCTTVNSPRFANEDYSPFPHSHRPSRSSSSLSFSLCFQ